MSVESDHPQASRSIRRHAKWSMKAHDRDQARTPVVKPKSVSTLLDNEDDFLIYKNELALSAKLEALQRINYQIYRLTMQAGVCEETYRRSLIVEMPGQTIYDRQEVATMLVSEIDLRRARNVAPLIQTLRAQFKRFNIRTNPSVEEAAEALLLLTDRNIPLDDLMKESIRSRHETTELIRMQVNWLEDERKKAKAQARQKPAELQVEASPDEPEIITPKIDTIKDQQEEREFILLGWDLFWTTRHWSKEPNHLIPIPTTSREAALEVFDQISRGEIMVRPSGVLKTLELHMRKDVIQQALATRMKYGPEERRGWIKIRIGRDRVLLSIPENHKAIFFAGNRDSIYR